MLTSLKLAIVKAVRPELEGVALEAAVSAISDSTAVAYALSKEGSTAAIAEIVKQEIQA